MYAIRSYYANNALVHLRAAKTPRPGAILLLDGNLRVQVTGRAEDLFEVEFSGVRSLPRNNFV